jgi:hypothetical protein
MSTLQTSTVQDAIAALPEGNPIMTVRIDHDANGKSIVDIVTKAGLDAQLKSQGVHVEARVEEKEKVAVDVGSDVVAALEKALENSPQGKTPQAAMLERAVNAPDATPAAPSTTPAQKPAMVIRAIDPEKAVYGLELDPANMNAKVLEQLKELASAQAFGEQTPAVVAKIEDAVYQARPDLKPQQQQTEAAQQASNVAQSDAQGEVQRVVANSTGSQARTDTQQQTGAEAAPQKVTPAATAIPMAQTSAQGEVKIPAAALGASLDEVGGRISSATSQGRVSEKQNALAM